MLAQFSSAHDDEAFAEVVRRYAAMVFAVCLRVCGNAHDAEDATQAAFLTLAVQCKSGRPVNRLGPWLRQVATRAALDVRRARKRRETHEQRHAGQRMHEVATIHREQGRNGSPASPASAGTSTSSDIDLEKLNRVMGEELSRLAPKYRLPLVCLYFSGMTREEVAKELGCTLGTLGVRVHRGRQMLARRLAARGLAPPDKLLSSELLTSAISTAGHCAMVERTATVAGQAALGHDLVATIMGNVLAALKAVGAASLFAKLKGVAMVAVMVGVTAVAAGGVTRNWETVGPTLPEVVRRVSEWIKLPGGWRVPVPRLRGPAPVTPLAVSHSHPRPENSAKLQAAFATVDDSALQAPVRAPIPGAPMTFTDERRVPAAPVMSLLERPDEPTAPLRAEPWDLKLDDHGAASWLRIDPVVLGATVRTDLLWGGSAAMRPVATPEPSAAAMALIAGGTLLLRRRRRN